MISDITNNCRCHSYRGAKGLSAFALILQKELKHDKLQRMFINFFSHSVVASLSFLECECVYVRSALCRRSV